MSGLSTNLPGTTTPFHYDYFSFLLSARAHITFDHGQCNVSVVTITCHVTLISHDGMHSHKHAKYKYSNPSLRIIPTRLISQQNTQLITFSLFPMLLVSPLYFHSASGLGLRLILCLFPCVTLLCKRGLWTDSSHFGQSSDCPQPLDSLAQGLPALGITLFSHLSYIPLNYICSYLYTCCMM